MNTVCKKHPKFH